MRHDHNGPVNDFGKESLRDSPISPANAPLEDTHSLSLSSETSVSDTSDPLLQSYRSALIEVGAQAAEMQLELEDVKRLVEDCQNELRRVEAELAKSESLAAGWNACRQRWSEIRQQLDQLESRGLGGPSSQGHFMETNAQRQLLLQEVQRLSTKLQDQEQQRALAQAVTHGWREVQSIAKESLEAEIRRDRLERERHIYLLQLQDAQKASDDFNPDERLSYAAVMWRDKRRWLDGIANGIKAYGFSGYLGRSPREVHQYISDIAAKRCAEGTKRSGRKPGRGANPTSITAKANRAKKARERRAAAAAAASVSESSARKGPLGDKDRQGNKENQRTLSKDHEHQKDQSGIKGSMQTTVTDPLAGSRPRRRQHEERLALLDPDDRVAYTGRLLYARRHGHAAAARDATLRKCIPQSPYQPAHAAIAIGSGARILAIRGTDDYRTVCDKILENPGYMDEWIHEAAGSRLSKMGNRSRLRFVAGHILAAWSPDLTLAAQAGYLNEALAYEADRIIARLDLVGHRVVVYLHTDSTSGHPHLHIVFSRIRESDGSLWSMEGRERVPALWLHARSNTAMEQGMMGLHDDVDALAGGSEAAISGEGMMHHGHLAIVRSPVHGPSYRVSIQDESAAQRLAQVGSLKGCLAGGIWRFGLGPGSQDGKEAQESKGKQANGIQHRPLNRGYWLRPVDTAAEGYEWRFRKGFGWYLKKKKLKSA